MADKVIKEHYVPRRHLRYFANGDKFFVYDKGKKQQRPGNINDYACERFFYDVDFDALKNEILEQEPDFEFDPEMEKLLQEIDEQHIEHWFGQNVETWLFDPLDKISTLYTMSNPQILNSIDVLNEENMDYISLFLAIQFMRSKEFRESITELHERLPMLLMKKFAKTQEEKDFANSVELKIKNENHKKVYHAQVLTDPEYAAHFAETFRAKIWMIGYNRTNMPFYTSDNPVVKFGHSGYSGFNSKGIEIFFPITTRLVLILKDPEHFYFEIGNHNHFVELDDVDVAFINSLQVQQSYRYVFDKSGDFKLAIGLMERNPKLSDIRHKRFLMG